MYHMTRPTADKSDKSEDDGTDEDASFKAHHATKDTTFKTVNANAVARMQLQNRFKTGLDIARYTAKIMREDMETMGPVRLRDVDQAQMGIVQTAKDLANKGEIMLAGSGGDDELIDG